MLIRFAVAAGVALWLCAGAPAAAQPPDEISTDRPYFTKSPLVVGARVVQLEGGVFWERDEVANTATRVLTAPNLLARIGVNDRLELRIAAEGLVRQHDGGTRDRWSSSPSDVGLGVKYQLASQSGLGLDLGVIASVSLPTGGESSSGNADPSLKIGWGRDLSDGAALTGNLNWAMPSNGSERIRVLQGSVSLGVGLWGEWGTFFEAVVSDVDVEDAPVAWTGNTGLTRLIGRDVQLDVHAGRGLNDAAPDWAIGAGVSFRFRR